MEICQQFVSKPFFFYKSQFFRSAGNVIQQLKKVSPYEVFDGEMIKIVFLMWKNSVDIKGIFNQRGRNMWRHEYCSQGHTFLFVGLHYTPN